jgi:rSAM/selenodomain-associated transferase 2/rSAM/selenodomain-associated transferase 1
MKAAADRLILFTRYPEPGVTKTRLVPVLGPVGAAEFQRRLTEHVARAAQAAAGRRGLELEIRYEGGSQARMERWIEGPFTLRPQGGGDLGRRMQSSFAAAFAEGVQRAILIGSDIPGLHAETILQAFDGLSQQDLVFGPAADGGYYLIGMTAACFRRGTPYLEADIGWGSAGVLYRTLDIAHAARLTCHLLETLTDVDRPCDLQAALATLCSARDHACLSVIIPALNEEVQLPDTLASLSGIPGIEIIVVDGGSSDATLEVARDTGVRTLAAHPPRAIQMNAGAGLAVGDILLFLHADTRLPRDVVQQVRQTLRPARVAAGAFHLSIAGALSGLRAIERVANWRSRLLQMPYGDQGLFLSRDLFWELGGFPPIPIMEDFELVRRLKRRGRIALAHGSARTSNRRWQRLGALKTWLINQAIVAAYYAGVPPQRLVVWYRGKI